MTCACVEIAGEEQTPLEELMRWVAMAIPAIPYEVGMEHLRAAYMMFARKSSLLVEHVEIELQAGVKDYEIPCSEGYEVYGVAEQCHNGSYFMHANAHHWFAYRGHRIRVDGNRTVVLARAPSCDGGKLELVLQVVPTQCSEYMPQEIANQFGMGIAKGAIAELLALPGKAWTDVRASRGYKREFYEECMAAKNLHLSNRGAHRVTMDYVRVI